MIQKFKTRRSLALPLVLTLLLSSLPATALTAAQTIPSSPATPAAPPRTDAPGSEVAPGTLDAPATGGVAAAAAFDDVQPGDWYYAVVSRAVEKGYMAGAGETVFDPNAPASDADIAVALARVAQADLARYAEEAAAQGAEAGQGYGQAAAWAKANGLFGDMPFDAASPISRGDLALVLNRFIGTLGLEYVLTMEYIDFSDAREMTEAENMAFQTLYKLGVFCGSGDRVMVPRVDTSRAELAALLYRTDALIALYSAA